jgi:indolepyruvate ferredoxin oxidoreductase beta subunit
MKTDIILAGVGGQGILTIAAAIGYAAMEENLHIKQAEVHGMSQRGGAVQSNLRISDKVIYSDLIPQGKADLILSVEPMEALRYLPYLSDKGWVITNKKAFKNIPNYPEEEKIFDQYEGIERKVLVDADGIACELGSIKSSNMVILGAASFSINLKTSSLIKGIEQLFASKGKEVIEMNVEAFNKGRQVAEKLIAMK